MLPAMLLRWSLTLYRAVNLMILTATMEEFDINGLQSVVAKPAGYYTSNEKSFYNLTLASGQPIQVWVEYDSVDKYMNVTMAPLHAAKPDRPLLSLVYDLSSVMDENVSIGCSASTGAVVSTHYILGWSFKMNGVAQGLDLSQLPKLPRVKRISHESRQGMREFVAEIVSIGRLRHRNLVPLLGYCRRKGELLLVYECMPNGSLDKYLFDKPSCTLDWNQRF